MSSGSNPLKRLRVFEPGELLETAEAVANKDSLAGVRRRFLVLGQGAIFSLPVNEESSRARLVPTSGSTVVGAEETMAKQLVLNKKIIEKKINYIYQHSGRLRYQGQLRDLEVEYTPDFFLKSLPPFYPLYLFFATP